MMTLIKERICPSLLLFCILLVPGSTHNRNSGPEFDMPLPKLTIKQGSDAHFTCIVKHLAEYKVAWIRSEDKAILAYHTTMVIHNHRFYVTHNGHNTWTLHIKNVQLNDTGSYLCQVNTDPQRSQWGTLEVVVPADIIDSETSSDVVVREGHPATLKCKATGFPPPKVRWKREDGQPLPLTKDLLPNPSKQIDNWEGELLTLKPLSRVDTGAYLCIANNSVPPTTSKRIYVYVHFEPLIKVSNQLVAAPAGINVTIDCIIEALPRPVVSWFNKEGQLILNSVDKHWTSTEILNNYSLKATLTIANLKKEDFSDYNCTAGNSFGSKLASIKLQQIELPPTIKPTPTTTQGAIWLSAGKVGNGKQLSQQSEHDREHLPEGIKHKHRKKPRTKNYNHESNNGDNDNSEMGFGDGVTTASSSSPSGTKNVLRNTKDTNSGRVDSPNLSPNSASSTKLVLISLPTFQSWFHYLTPAWSWSVYTVTPTDFTGSQQYQHPGFESSRLSVQSRIIRKTSDISSKCRLPSALIPSLVIIFFFLPMLFSHCTQVPL